MKTKESKSSLIIFIFFTGLSKGSSKISLLIILNILVNRDDISNVLVTYFESPLSFAFRIQREALTISTKPRLRRFKFKALGTLLLESRVVLR